MLFSFFFVHFQHPILISSSCDFKSELFSFLSFLNCSCLLFVRFFFFYFFSICRQLCLSLLLLLLVHWLCKLELTGWLAGLSTPFVCCPEYKCREFNFNWFLRSFSVFFFCIFWGKMMSIVCGFFLLHRRRLYSLKEGI